MKTVKLGKVTMAQFAAEKPIAVRSTGELVYAQDILSGKSAPKFGMALSNPENKIKLAVGRLELEPDFTTGVLNNGSYTKKQILSHVENQTTLGKQIADMESKYAEYLLNQILGNTPVAFAKPTQIKATPLPKIPDVWRWVPSNRWHLFANTVIFCENTTDSVTQEAATYRKNNVHPVFTKQGYKIISLEGIHDTRVDFVNELSKKRVVYISGIGHGSYTTYTGHLFNNILSVGAYNNSEVSGKLLHLLSCETGRDLGPNTVNNGAKGYAGYTENFIFDFKNSSKYWPCDSQIDISLALGRTFEQAINDAYTKYDAAISSVPGTITASYLLNDKNLLRSPVSGNAWGSKVAKIYPYIFFLSSVQDI